MERLVKLLRPKLIVYSLVLAVILVAVVSYIETYFWLDFTYHLTIPQWSSFFASTFKNPSSLWYFVGEKLLSILLAAGAMYLFARIVIAQIHWREVCEEDNEELKILFEIIDGLLAKLPQEVIDEFKKSEKSGLYDELILKYEKKQ